MCTPDGNVQRVGDQSSLAQKTGCALQDLGENAEQAVYVHAPVHRGSDLRDQVDVANAAANGSGE